MKTTKNNQQKAIEKKIKKKEKGQNLIKTHKSSKNILKTVQKSMKSTKR